MRAFVHVTVTAPLLQHSSIVKSSLTGQKKIRKNLNKPPGQGNINNMEENI